ncbi:MAG: arsenate reductase family protein [Epsilonproteobacteria bacterium]|nr:MAG: arsenate reductase family protein [Campylobacterota bacterium]
MLALYGIKNCDSVRKAIAYLKKYNIAYTFIDFKETPASTDIIKKWLIHVDMQTLFNTRSSTYRNLKLKTLNLNSTEKIKWLAKENLLIKRPVIVSKDEVIVGYDTSIYASKLH